MTTIILTVIFWVFMFSLQAFTVWRSFTLEIDHPIVRSFTHRYAFTSSAELFVFIGFAAVLTALVYARHSAWSAAGLCLLFGFALWRYFFAGMTVWFRPPLGDGSWTQAFAAYLRINANFIGLRIFQNLLLFALFVLWPMCFRRLHALNRNA